jgi:hypothetical protein
MATDAQIFDIKTIQVMIYTNDPQNRIIEMKGSIFGFGDTRAFFSDSALYSSEALNELTGYDPVEKRRIFFDQDLFYNFLEFSYSKNPTPDNTINVRGCNFKIMIDALFVVSFPVPKMVKIDKPEGYNCIEINTDFLVKNVREFFQKNIYTHLSTKSKKYTVLDTKWPNKITTNPDYTTSLVQSLGIYKKGKENFDSLKKDIVKKKIEEMMVSVGTIPDVTPDVNGHVFKSYTISDGNGKINDIIGDTTTKKQKNKKTITGRGLIGKLYELQKEFYYYTYLWILYLTVKPKSNTKSNDPNREKYLYSIIANGQDVTPGIFYTQALSFLVKFGGWTGSQANDLFSTIDIPAEPGLSPKPAQKYDIDKIVKNDIMSDFDNNKNLTNEHLYNDIKVGNNKDYTHTLSNFQGFQFFLINFLKVSGLSIPDNLGININDGNSKSSFVQAVEEIILKSKPGIAIGEYGFDTKNGLYYKIRDLIETIDFLGNEFKTMVDGLNETSGKTPDIEGILEEFKTRMVRVNEILEKGDRINIKDIVTLFEEIINGKKTIELSDTVETSRFQNTKKSRDPIWEKLYKESWYKNFANGLLEITQLRRSSNNAINTALGESGQYKISELETLVKTEAEAGIDEINIGGNRGENLPTFKANLFCVVVGGEITDKNRGSIRCPYSSQKIGALLSRLWLKLPENKDLRRTDFVDLTAIIKKVEQDAIAKNKTQKNHKPKEENGVHEIVKGYGLERYDDERIKDFVRRGGDQGFLGNFFGQGQQQNLEIKPQPAAAMEQDTEISGYVKQFIEDNIKEITDYKSTGLNTSSFSDRYIINTQDDIIKFLASKEPKTIPILNEAIKLSTEIIAEDNKKQKITEKIIGLISKYETTIKKSTARMKTLDYQNDEKKKQDNYLELYNATIMKNLFNLVSEELESIGVDLLTRLDSASSPKGQPAKKGGSRKRKVIHKRNRTHRK